MFKKVKSFLFENRTVWQTVAKNTVWLAISNFGGRLLRTAVIIYAARILGATDWGVFSYGMSLIALLTILTDFGLSPVLTRETTKAKDRKEKISILSTAFFLKVILLALGVILVMYFIPLIVSVGKLTPLLPLFALILTFDALRDFAFSLSRAMEKMELEAGLFIVTNAAIVVVGMVTLTLSPTVQSFTYAYMTGLGVGLIATFAVLRINLKDLLTHFKGELVGSLFHSAWPFATAALLGGLMINTDILLIGILRSIEDVGHYSAAERPILFLYLLSTIVATSTFPVFTRLGRTGGKELRRFFERVIGFVSLLSIPVALGGAILAEPIVRLLFGLEYLPGAAPFRILMFTLLVNFPAVIISNVLFALDRQKILIRFAALGALSNVLLDLLLIPPLGIAGSAWATLFSQLLANFYLWRRTKEVFSFEILPHLEKIVRGALIMAIFTLILAWGGMNIFVTVALSALLYVTLLVIFKEPLLKETGFFFGSHPTTSLHSLE